MLPDKKSRDIAVINFGLPISFYLHFPTRISYYFSFFFFKSTLGVLTHNSFQIDLIIGNICIWTVNCLKWFFIRLDQTKTGEIELYRSSWSRGSVPSSHARGQRFEPRRRQYFKLLLDPGDFHSNPSGLLSFNKSETVLWTIAKILYYHPIL